LVFVLLAGCTPAPEKAASASAGGGATAQAPLIWAGSGVVQSVTLAASTGNPLKRIGIRMDDGRILYVDTPSPDFTVGTAVQLTDDQQINRF
jgi:hypothetical protein